MLAVGSAGGARGKAEFEALTGGIDPEGRGDGGGEPAGIGEDGVQLVVGAVGVVVEEQEMFDAGVGGLADHGIDAAMAPADAGGVFGGGVLGVVDENVRLVDEGADVALAAQGGTGWGGLGAAGGVGATDLVVGRVDERACRGIEAEGDASARVMDSGGAGADLADAESEGAQLFDGDGAGHLGEGDGEEGGFDGSGDRAFEAGPGASPAEDADFLTGEVGGGEEGETLDVVPVGVGDEDADAGGVVLQFTDEGFAQFADAGAGVEDDDIAAPSGFDAGGVAAVADGLGAWDGDGTADAPEADGEGIGGDGGGGRT